MEQTMNACGGAADGEEGLRSWRSIGAVAAAWASEVEARRTRPVRPVEEPPCFAPVAWAAE